jgi:ABC-type multidrug transport system fused ATPase/permease subunit
MTPYLPSPKTAIRGWGASRAFDSPEDGTTLISWLLVDWLNPLLALARKRTLEDEDIWQLSPYFQHSIIYPAYVKMKPSTFMGKMYAFTAFDIAISSVCSLSVAILTYSAPYILNKILKVLDPNNRDADKAEMRAAAYKLAFLAFVLNILKAFIEVFRQFHGRRAYERSRGILITMVFDKATKRKDTSGSVGHRKADEDEEEVAGSDAGNILNMMNGDA